jgi:WD repeat-containing protein 35
MFVFLNKKINMPNDTKIRAISWNPIDNLICCGGEQGILKLIQLDETKQSKGGLSVNIALEDHQRTIHIICWNPVYKFLSYSEK